MLFGAGGRDEVVRSGCILDRLEGPTSEFCCGLSRRCIRKRSSRVTLRFLVRAVGRISFPSTEKSKGEGEAGLGRRSGALFGTC